MPFPSTGRISLGHDASDHRLADDFTACGYAAAAATAAGGDANFITTFGLAAAAAGSNISVRLRQAGLPKPHDYLLALLAYRHGFRVSELVDVRLEEIDLRTARMQVRRLKGSLSTEHPIEGDELRALRAWPRIREQSKFADLPFLFLGERGPMTRQAVNYLFEQIGKRARLAFKVRPHMLRHSCGYYLANKGFDTRLIQDYLGHQNIHHTVRYTRTASKRFEGLWRK